MNEVFSYASYGYNAHGAAVIITGTGILLLGAYILFQSSRIARNRAFFFLCLSLFVWLAGFGLISFCNNDNAAMFWAKIIELGVVFIPANMFFLVSTLLPKETVKKPFILTNYFISFLFFMLVLGTDLFVAGVQKFYWGYYNLYGIVGYAYVFYFVVVMVVSVFLLWKASQKAKTNIRKKQFFLMLLAIVVAYLASIDFLPHFGVPVYPLGYIPIFVFAYIISYAMIRYRVFAFSPSTVAENLLLIVNDPVFMLDVEGKISMANKRASTLLGLSDDKLVDKPFYDIFAFKNNEQKEELARLLAKEEKIDNYFVDLKGPGKNVPVNLSWNTVRSDESDILGILVLAHDMTEINKLIEKEIKRADELDRLRDDLERKVRERTSELENAKKILEEKVADLEQFHNLAVGRELRMEEIEKENKELKRQIDKLKQH